MKPAPIYAWVTVMPNGAHSIVGVFVPQMAAHLPLVGFTRSHIERFGDVAREHCDSLKQPCYFVEFGTMRILTPAN